MAEPVPPAGGKLDAQLGPDHGRRRLDGGDLVDMAYEDVTEMRRSRVRPAELDYDQLVEIGDIDQLEPAPGLGIVVGLPDVRPLPQARRSRVPPGNIGRVTAWDARNGVLDALHLPGDTGADGAQHGRTVGRAMVLSAGHMVPVTWAQLRALRGTGFAGAGGGGGAAAATLNAYLAGAERLGVELFQG